MNDALGMNLFRRHQRKSLAEVEPHLITETTDSAGTGSIMLLHAMVKYMREEIEILLHGRNLGESNELCAMRYEV